MTTETAFLPELLHDNPLPADGHVRVWAPQAERVDLHEGPAGAATVSAMTPDEHMAAHRRPGWWVSDHPLADHTDYAFAVDGSDPRPDPRSLWQPQGVHAPSRTFDATAFDWQDTGWRGRNLLGTVLYEMHVGTFTEQGTLDAAIEKLPHLTALGVQTIELMPLAAFPGARGWGYDGVSLWSVHEAYGGPQALQRFVDAAHRAGMSVILDVVYNHLGPAGNYLGVFGPYFTDRHQTPWGTAVNLDGPGAGEVRAFIIENALHWLRDFHVDGLRLDAVHALIDDSEQHLLAELSVATRRAEEDLGRTFTLTAESDLNDPRMVMPVGEVTATGQTLGQDAQWADDVHHALHTYLTGENHGYYADFGSPQVLAKVMEEAFLHAGTWSSFRGREWGAPVPADMDRHRFIVFSQNHDQVGNRAIGDRPSRTQSPAQLVGAAALVLLSHYTPMLFQGEEWGTRRPFQYFTDHDPELGALVSKGRMTEFAGHGWDELYGEHIDVPDPQALSTFTDSVLDWSEPEAGEHARVLDAYRALVALRHQVPSLASGDAQGTTVHAEEGLVVMRRGEVDVIVSNSPEPQQVTLRAANPQVLFDFDEQAEIEGNTLRLPSHGVLVLRHAQDVPLS